MICGTRPFCRFPARDRRWRPWPPQEAQAGAVPFQDAKWPRPGNRVMSPAPASSRAAPDGPIPSTLLSVVRAAFSAAASSWPAAFWRWQLRSRSAMSPAATRRRAAHQQPGPPSASSRRATGPPVPRHPSIAHTRCGQCRTAPTIARYPDGQRPSRPRPSTVSSPSITSIAAHRRYGPIPTTTALIALLLRPASRNFRGPGRAPLLRAEQPPLEPLPAHRTRPPQAKQEPPNQHGQPKSERERGQSQVKVGWRHVRYVADTTSDNVSTTQPGGRVKLHGRHPRRT